MPKVRECKKCGSRIVAEGRRIDIVAPRFYLCRECNEYLANLRVS